MLQQILGDFPGKSEPYTYSARKQNEALRILRLHNKLPPEEFAEEVHDFDCSGLNCGECPFCSTIDREVVAYCYSTQLRMNLKPQHKN